MAKRKQNLSAEELHRIRSEASKRGWITRKANKLKAEQQLEFEELGFEEVPTERTEAIRNVDDVFNDVILTIDENIPYEDVTFWVNTARKQRIQVDTNNWRDYLKGIVYDRIYATEEEHLNDLADYYEQYQEALKECLQHAFVPSNTVDEARSYIAQAAAILNNGILTYEQLQQLGELLDNM